jgi:4-aminobutyrate aminotransferase-like enzyme
VWVPGGYTGTFRGNVLSCACGLAGIEFMQNERLIEYADQLGKELLRRLKDLEKNSKIIGEVRGKGLMIGIELVEDKKTKKPLTEGTARIHRKCFERGVLMWKCGHWSNVLKCMPPLVITKELAEKALTVFEDVLNEEERSI